MLRFEIFLWRASAMSTRSHLCNSSYGGKNEKKGRDYYEFELFIVSSLSRWVFREWIRENFVICVRFIFYFLIVYFSFHPLSHPFFSPHFLSFYTSLAFWKCNSTVSRSTNLENRKYFFVFGFFYFTSELHKSILMRDLFGNVVDQPWKEETIRLQQFLP